MKKAFFPLFTIFVGLIFSQISIFAVSKGIPYQKISLNKQKLNLSSLNLTDCEEALEIEKKLFITTCQNRELDNEDDYGIRVYLISAENSKLKVLFESPGALDSYYLLLDTFMANKALFPYVILAEYGAEESWGIEVYLFDKRNIKSVGFLKVGIEYQDAGGPVLISAVPVTKISKEANKFFLSFDKDVVFVHKNGKYEKISKKRLKYVLLDGKLKNNIE